MDLTVGPAVREQSEFLHDLLIQTEVEKYIVKMFKPLATSNQQLLAEYESVKSTARMAMKMWVTYKDNDAKEMLSQCELKASQILVSVFNPAVGRNLSLIQGNDLWFKALPLIEAAAKLTKIEEKIVASSSGKAYGSTKIGYINKSQKYFKEEKEKDERKDKQEGKLERKCFACNSPDHLLSKCPLKNKQRDDSVYVQKFFLVGRGNRRTFESYSFNVQRMASLGKEKSISGSDIYIKRWSKGKSFSKDQEIPCKSKPVHNLLIF